MPDGARQTFAYILAQVLAPLREQTAFLQSRIGSVNACSSIAGEDDDSDGRTDNPSLDTQAPDLVEGSVSSPWANLEVDGDSLLFQLTEEDLSRTEDAARVVSGSVETDVAAAIRRVEEVALGVMKSVGMLAEASVKHVSGVTAVAQGQEPARSHADSVAASQSTPSEDAGLPVAARVRNAQRSAARIRSTSPSPNIPVTTSDGHRDHVSWQAIEKMMAEGRVQNVTGVGWVMSQTPQRSP